MPQPPEPAEDTTLWASSHVAVPYLGYEVNTSYRGDNGILQVPVAGPPGTSCELISLHAGVMRKSVAVGARRAGSPPVMPALQGHSSDEVLAGFTVAPQSPALDGDGNTYIYRTSTAHEFYLRNILSAEDGLFRMGSAPYTTTSSDFNVLLTTDFSSTIL